MLRIILRSLHVGLFVSVIDLPILSNNQNIIQLGILAKIGTLISWRFHGGCILTTIENKIVHIFDPNFNYQLAQSRHLTFDTPKWCYGCLMFLVVLDTFKLFMGQAP